MGQSSCCLEQYRPRYKHHVRAAVYDGKTRDLGKYASRIRTQLYSISRYLRKQVETNISNHKYITNAMQSWDELIENCHEDLAVFEITLLDSIEQVLFYGYQNNDCAYLMESMHTLHVLLPYVHNKPFPHNRFEKIYEILLKVCNSDWTDTSAVLFNGFQSDYRITVNHPLLWPFSLRKNHNYNANTRSRLKHESILYCDKNIYKQCLRTFELLISNSSKEVTRRYFEPLMQLFLHSMNESIDLTAESKFDESKCNESFELTYESMQTIATRCFELLCDWVNPYSPKELNSFLECLQLDFQWDTSFSNRTLLLVLRKSKASGFEIAKATVDMMLRVDELNMKDLDKVQMKIRMLKSLIEFSAHVEKNRNPYEIVSKLCDLFEWLDNVSITYIPHVRICCSDNVEQISSPPIVKERDDSSMVPSSETDSENGHTILPKYNSNGYQSLSSGNANKNKNKNSKKLLDLDNERRDAQICLIDCKFVLANACLKCISDYVSYHDVHPILQRAILPRLQKATGFHHKRYLLYAALETALRRRSASRPRPLEDHIIRIILQCPFTEKKAHYELHELSHLLIQNLLLPQYNVRYNSENTNVYSINVRLFEKQFGKEEDLSVSQMNIEHKKWIYAILYKECQNFISNKMLKTFAMTAVIAFCSIRNWSEELLDVLPFLRALEETALSMEGDLSNRNYRLALHTVVLSLLMLLIQCMKSSPYKQELLSYCQEIRSYRQAHGQILSSFNLDNLGRIEVEGEKIPIDALNADIIPTNPISELFDEPSTTMTCTTTDAGIPNQPQKTTKKPNLKLTASRSAGGTTNCEGENSSLAPLPITPVGTGDSHDIILPPAEPLTPVLRPISARLASEDEDEIQSIDFPRIVPILAKAAKVISEMHEEWCKNALRAYDPTEDYDTLMQDPARDPYDERTEYTIGYSIDTDRSLPSSTLPNELVFGLDPFDPKNDRRPVYEVYGSELGANDMIATEELDIHSYKTFAIPLEKVNKFHEISFACSHQFDYTKHATEAFLDNIIQSRNDVLALEYFEHSNKQGKRMDEKESGASERHSLWNNWKARAMEFREKSPTPQPLTKDIHTRAPAVNTIQKSMEDSEISLLSPKYNKEDESEFDIMSTKEWDDNPMKYRVQYDILPYSEIVTQFHEKPSHILPVDKVPICYQGAIMTPEFAHRLDLEELELEQELPKVEEELARVDIIRDGPRYYHTEPHLQPSQHFDSVYDLSFSDSEHLPQSARKFEWAKKNTWREQAQERFRAFGRGVEKSLKRIAPRQPIKRNSDGESDDEKDTYIHNIEVQRLDPPHTHMALGHIAENAATDENCPTPLLDSNADEFKYENLKPEPKQHETKQDPRKPTPPISQSDISTKAKQLYQSHIKRPPPLPLRKLHSTSDISTDSESGKKINNRLKLNLLSLYGSNKHRVNPKDHEFASENDDDHNGATTDSSKEELGQSSGVVQ